MKHLTEDELIAYQMGELTDAALARAIAQHVEECSLCAGDAEEIARTLRVYSAAPVQIPNADHAWQRLLVSLPVLQPDQSRWDGLWPRQITGWLKLALPVLAAILVATGLMLHLHTASNTTGHLPPGPISERPRTLKPNALDAQGPGVAAHLEDAERLLTTLSHEPGSLDADTRAQAQHLLLENAVYVRQARASGDFTDASVLEDLGRTLTTLNHEQEADKRWHLRMEVNANGLLLDIRILQQNGSQPVLSATSR